MQAVRSSTNNTMRAEEKQMLISAVPGLLFVALLWFIHFMSWVTGLDISFLGIYPRHVQGLAGILFAPLIHSDLLHLLSNSFPIILLSALLFHNYRRIAAEAVLWIWLTTNIWAFFLARQNYHIGASGIVYGLASFLLFSGLFRRDQTSISLSAIILVLYGGLVYGVLPLEEGVSWESHLFGGIAGLLVAWHFRKHDRPVKVTTQHFRHEDLELYSDPFAPWNLTAPEQWLDFETYQQAQQQKQQLLIVEEERRRAEEEAKKNASRPVFYQSTDAQFRIVFRYDYRPNQPGASNAENPKPTGAPQE